MCRVSPFYILRKISSYLHKLSPICQFYVGIRQKYLISESCTFVVCSVIFPGYMDGELIKKSDSKAQILKSGSTTKFQSNQEENKEELQKKISFIDSDEVVIAEHKRELSNFQDVELQKGKIEMEVKVKDSNAEIMKRRESQEKVRGMKMPREAAAQVEESEAEVLQRQEAQVEKNEAETAQGQEARGKKSEVKIPKGQEAQQEESEIKILQGL